jgi:regulator of sigma E protease
MEWMAMVAQLLLSLSFLVAVHEFGHLLAAKYFGMRVEQFSIGFPPKIWSFRKGETEYAISAIPLGGYVKISGMIDESLDTETMNQEPQPWEFRSKPAWQRLIVMLGGIFVNVVVGIIIFIGITFVFGDTYVKKDYVNSHGGFAVGETGKAIGLQTGDTIIKINGKDFDYMEDIVDLDVLLAESDTYTIERDGKEIVIDIPENFIQNFNSKGAASKFVSFRFTPVVKRIKKGSLADKVGMKVGDIIVDVDGIPITYFDEIQSIVSGPRTDTVNVSFKVLRDGKVLSFSGKFAEREEGEPRSIGFNAGTTDEFKAGAEHIIKYSFIKSIPLGTERAFGTLFNQIKAFGKIVTGKLPFLKSVSGPIGIVQAFDPGWNWETFWSLTGILSLVLAFMNLLPIPALDGGHVMFLSYELISRRKPSDKFLEVAQKVGMVFLLILMVVIFGNDIVKLVKGLGIIISPFF